jgi:hypothetical protein
MLWSNKFKKIVLIFMHQSLSIKQIVIPHPVKTTSLQDMQEKDLCLKFQSQFIGTYNIESLYQNDAKETFVETTLKS